MPQLSVRKASEAPPPSRLSRTIREQQEKYDEFVRRIDTNEVGDLELDNGENVRSVKVRLRRASTRVGADLEIWDVNGHVYFRKVTRRGRPRKTG
jgi:hypothetical protein